MSSPLDIDLDIYHDEAELLAALRRQERLACTCMFKQFAHRLHTLAHTMLKDADEADDVVQESFIQACAHIRNFEGRSSLHTWLYRITTNTALMRRRRKEFATVTLATYNQDEPVSAELVAYLVDDNSTPDQAVLSKELREHIYQAVRSLPLALREAFILRMIDGLSTKDAAAKLGIEESALKVRVHRARQELRRKLGNMNGA